MRNGVFTRGVLLDVASAQGRPWLEKGERVHVEDLELAEQYAATRVQPGDVLVVRTGGRARVAVEAIDSPYAPGFRRTGWEFVFTLAPLRIQRGTGSPMIPLAVL